ncbi:MAG: polysaccharide deacetylase family protein [Thermomicrobiales bacterium]|nr:polysaccharide deacetylase family protein [Thermomicrobiales bacterium]
MSGKGSSHRGRFHLIVAALLAMATLSSTFALAPRQADAADAADVLTVRTFDTDQKLMALTFDAGSDTGYTAQILDTLKSKGVKATFGMTGLWAQANPALLQRIVNEGHQLINHSWDHPSFPSLTTAQRESQLSSTENLVHDLTGVWMKPYFRPPYGEYDTATLRDIAANDYTVNVMWTTDTLGWNGATVSQINTRVLNDARPGGVVLMHVGAASQDAAALPGMIDQLRARGYEFQRASDFLEPQARYFPETGFSVDSNFLRYWNEFGGLARFGYPLTDVFTRDGIQMQYFERVRMELHPGEWPSHHDVLLGLLGVELTEGRHSEQPFLRSTGASDANCNFYAETGHHLCFGFRAYWQANGGLAMFGFPISEEFRERNNETGEIYTVQYFERARFEYHPENQSPWDILGGHLGRTAYEEGL